jgi:hypothetical protein
MTVALVVFNVQITFDPHSLASIYVLFFLGAMLPKGASILVLLYGLASFSSTISRATAREAQI